ncbi:hypothetical protein V502_11374 [Pseudogymnoascus sp. VKM F-4520 (FW-2644)]|nr:hypothetical protein V502_11374 [Pseudogymnoascus sp. VKM F-4520 (FW-2644)]
MGKLIGLLSSSIGLAMEAASTQSSKPPRVYDSSRYERANYHSRSLDGVQQSQLANSSDENYARREFNEADDEIYDGQQFRSEQPLTQGGLSYPVVIPQRRPENKSRGWSRAYAPALEGCGIDQETFLSFIESFNRESQSSPYLDAVNVAALGVGFAPGIAPMVISTALPIAVKYAKQSQTNHKTKTYLDRMNEELFVPHGLFAMVMTYKPEQSSAIVNTNSISSSQLQDTAANRFENPEDIRTQQFQMPEASPLIFFESGSLPTDQPSNRLNKITDFVSDYHDRRARARFAQDNPGSPLAGPAPKFGNRFADPTSANNNGSLPSTLSGNDRRSDKETSKRSRKEERKAQKEGRRELKDNGNQRGRLIHGLVSNIAERSGHGGSYGRGGPRLISGVRGMVNGSGSSTENRKDQGLLKSIKSIGANSDVLYLMIVNNPTSDIASREPRSPHGRRQNPEEVYDWQEDPQLDYSYDGAPSGERFNPRDRHYPTHDEQYTTDNDGRFEQRVAPYQYQHQQDTPSSQPPRYNGMVTRRDTRPQNWDRNDDRGYCVTGF